MPDTLQKSLSRDKSRKSDPCFREGISDVKYLVQLARSGEQKAFERLFELHKGKIFSICLEYSKGDQAQAHDLCQETFISAYDSLHQLRDDSLFPYWLREIARHRCISYWRKQRYLLRMLNDYEVIQQGDEKREWSAADLEVIAELIEGLEDSDIKQTVQLFYQEGKHSGEIAEILGISQTAVTTRLNRFRLKFRKRIIQRILTLRASRE